MPPIILGLLFETELGVYFETTIRWYSIAGETSTTPGFRMMELHLFLHDFVQKWWTKALVDPNDVFPRTFKYINEIWKDDIEEKRFRTHQIMKGVRAGHDEILKMSKGWFRVPLLYLVLLDLRRAPSLMRAINRILCSNGVISPDTCAERNHSAGCNVVHVSKSESIWFNKLKEDEENAVHYFKQFGLDRDIVRNELAKLSKMSDNPSPTFSFKRPLHEFKSKFPITYDAFDSIFRLMPSNSRIMEQLHGILRESIETNDTIQFTNAQARYSSNCYETRKERKKVIEKRGEFKGHDQMKGKHTGGIKHDRTKEQLAMLGEQAMERKKMYAGVDIQSLPYNIRTKMGIKNIAKDGSSAQDKIIAKRKREAYDEKATRLKVTMLTKRIITQKANHTDLTNDEMLRAEYRGNGVSKEDKIMIEKFMRVGYWNSARKIKAEARKVFPCLPLEEYVSLLAGPMKNKIKQHIYLLQTEAKDANIKTMFNRNVDGKSEVERLAMFVIINDEGTDIFAQRAKEQNELTKYKTIFSSAGSDITFDEWRDVKCALGVDVVNELVMNGDEDDVPDEEIVGANAIVDRNPAVEQP